MKYSNSGEMAGIEFQKELEREAWKNGGHTQQAPAQRLADFVTGETSSVTSESILFPGSYIISSSQLAAKVNWKTSQGWIQTFRTNDEWLSYK